MTTEAIWHALSDDLRRFLRARVADDATADDLLQETFLRVHKSLDGLRDDERLAAWVYRIARNVLADHRRRPAATALAAEPAVDEEPDDPAPSLARWLAEMVDTLDAPYRDALRAVELEGRTQADAAREAGLSLSGMKARVQRGRAQLRGILARCCDVELDRRGRVREVTERKPGCC